MDNNRPLTLNDYPKGPVLAEWACGDLKQEEGGNPETLTKKNYELLASYNWVPVGQKDGKATLVVPGKFSICALDWEMSIINMVHARASGKMDPASAPRLAHSRHRSMVYRPARPPKPCLSPRARVTGTLHPSPDVRP